MSHAYRTAEVAKVAGVSPSLLHYWDRTRFLSPSLRNARGSGTRRAYSFADLITARVARGLRANGVPLQRLRQIVNRLRRPGEADNPLSRRYLVVRGKDVLLLENDCAVSVLLNEGQGVLDLVLDLKRTLDDAEAVVRMRGRSPGAARRPRGAAARAG
jgi:DNA-binding transcriptional MerR regulator